MASQALLAAAAALKAAPKKQKRALKQPRPRSSSPLEALPGEATALAALMPDLVRPVLAHRMHARPLTVMHAAVGIMYISIGIIYT